MSINQRQRKSAGVCGCESNETFLSQRSLATPSFRVLSPLNASQQNADLNTRYSKNRQIWATLKSRMQTQTGHPFSIKPCSF